MTATIGLDIGGTKALGVLLDENGSIGKEVWRPSPPEGLDPLVATAAEIVAELRSGDEAVGVGIAGLVDRDGNVRYSPNLQHLFAAPVRAALGDATGARLVVDNDANVAAVGESEYGAARNARHVLMVTLGTGIGGGLLLDGRLYRGANNFAGEIGHFTVDRDGPPCACGARGHWEAIASGSALGRMAREVVARGGGAGIVAAAGGERDDVSGVFVRRAADQGDPEALALVAEYADNIALGLAGLADVLDPERIVIAGGVVEMWSVLFGPLHARFLVHLEGDEYRPPIAIVPAELGEHAGAVGAAVLARGLDR